MGIICLLIVVITEGSHSSLFTASLTSKVLGPRSPFQKGSQFVGFCVDCVFHSFLYLIARNYQQKL